MTLGEARAVLRHYKAAADRRDEAIRTLKRADTTIAEIVRLSGLSRTGVEKILARKSAQNRDQSMLAIIDLAVRDAPPRIPDQPGYAWQVLDGDDEVFAGTCNVASEDEDEWTRQADALLTSEGFRRIGPWRDGDRDDTAVAEVEYI